MTVFREKRPGKSPGTWRARFQHQGRRHEAAGFSKKEDGKVWEAEEKKRLKTQKTHETHSILLLDAATQYLEDCQARMARNTWRAKASYYRAFIKEIGRHSTLHSVTSSQVNRFILKIKSERGNKNANRHLKDLKALFNWCSFREEMNIVKNPCLYVEPLAEEPFIKYVPPIEDVKRVLAVASQEERELLTIIMHTFGGRVGEILRLRWQDVFFESRSIVLWTKKRKRGEYKEVKKPMDDTLFHLLQKKAEGRSDENKYVLVNPRTGKQYSVRPRWMQRICERAEVPPFGYHSIRHAVAHYLDHSGEVSLKEISELLGHERPSTTDNYLRGLSRSFKNATRILDGLNVQE